MHNVVHEMLSYPIPRVQCIYRILSSKHPSPCKGPPLFDDPMVYDIWLFCVNADPHFFLALVL